VLHGHDDLRGSRVRNEIHGAAEALDLTGEHPCSWLANSKERSDGRTYN
jgi:hypothetical protein